MFLATTDEMVEKYINGNIEIVKHSIKDKGAWALEIRERIADLYGEEKAKMFSETINT